MTTVDQSHQPVESLLFREITLQELDSGNGLYRQQIESYYLALVTDYLLRVLTPAARRRTRSSTSCPGLMTRSFCWISASLKTARER